MHCCLFEINRFVREKDDWLSRFNEKVETQSRIFWSELHSHIFSLTWFNYAEYNATSCLLVAWWPIFGSQLNFTNCLLLVRIALVWSQEQRWGIHQNFTQVVLRIESENLWSSSTTWFTTVHPFIILFMLIYFSNFVCSGSCYKKCNQFYPCPILS